MFNRKSSFLMNILITCEHGGNLIPKEFLDIIQIDNNVLNSHYGYDAGALDLANFLYKNLKEQYNCKILINTITRLLIDFNRSLNHPKLFSKYSKKLPENYKKFLLEKYQIFRNNSKNYIEDSFKKNIKTLHLSIHSFTNILNQKIRKTEIGILFDPKRQDEYQFAKIIKSNLSYQCHFNLPYRGISDGHTQSLRLSFTKNYLGIEIEVNQKFLNKKKCFPLQLKKDILYSINNYLKMEKIF